jgi:hypothetical protein
MPDPADQAKQDREREYEAEEKHAMAVLGERGGEGNLDRRFGGAARDWKQIALDYAKRAGTTDFEDRLAWRCRAAMAWLKAARDFANAASHAKVVARARDLADESQAAYANAARLFEACARGHIERGELIQAAGDLEQAQLCYERCADAAGAERAGKLAGRVEDALDSGVLKQGD